jgi:hypothetical protein
VLTPEYCIVRTGAAVLDDGRADVLCADHVDVVAGRYRLGPVLNRSAGSCAHRAYDELLQRTVRVTLVEADPTTSASFSVRPQGWHDRDPEVAELFDAGSEHGRLFLVTHHPEEPTLAETTPPGGLDLGQLRELGTAVATTLLPRHQRGAAHGGLGAGTVAFTAQGTSLAEFGLLPWLARWGDVPVTPPFPAPEQRTGADSGPASDVYALGRLLGELAPDHGMRPGLRSLLADMTAESPTARPSMEEVLRRLAGRRRAAAASAACEGRRRRGLGLVAAACLLVGLAVGLSAFAGEVPAVGSDGATLAATAAVPAPIIPLGPLLPATAAGGDAVSERTASGPRASAATATATARGASTGSPAITTDATTDPDGSDVVDAADRTSTDRTSTGTHGGSDADSTDRSSRSTTPDPDTHRDADATTPRSSRTTTGRSGDDGRSGQQLRRVLTQVASLGHHGTSGSGDGGNSGGADHGSGTTGAHDDAPQKATSHTPLDSDVPDPAPYSS